MRSEPSTSRLRALLGAASVTVTGATVFLLTLATSIGTPAAPISAIGIPPGPRPISEWATTDGPGSTHSSELADITSQNVGRLEVAWTYRTGDVAEYTNGEAGTAFQATPVMVAGTLYFSTPFSRVIALDAETGEERWTFDPQLDRSASPGQRMLTSRGVAVWDDPDRGAPVLCAVRVFSAAYDARLFALDAATGVPCADFAGGRGSVDLTSGVDRLEGREETYRVASPPTVVHDLVVIGSTIFDNLFADAPSGVVRAYDARSGALRWGWEPLPGVGGTSSDGRWIPAGAANTWATITADEHRDLLFLATSSPSPDHYGGLRLGENGYANSVVALRASTGELVWHYQIVHHDLWDYDLAAAPALIEVERDGERIPAVVQGTKMGHLFVLHRDTGEPLFPIVERPVPSSDIPGEQAHPTQPVPLVPRSLARQHLDPADAWGLTSFDRFFCRKRIERLRNDGPFAPPSLRGTLVIPGFLGGIQWGGIGWSAADDLIVVNSTQLATVATLIPRADMDLALRASAEDGVSFVGDQQGTPYGVRRELLLSPLGIPCTPPPWGTLAGVDLSTGEVRWEVPLGNLRDVTRVATPRAWGAPNLGGPLVTADLVFIAATPDRRIRAFALGTGELVWEETLPASAHSAPMTYRSQVGGQQILVIAAGGHSLMRSRLGDYVVAYRLPLIGTAGEGSP